MEFCCPQKVLFRHCDPAGIVFFPRYFEMLNDAVEALFEQLLNWPFEQIHAAGQAVPTAHISTDFHAPSRHGDQLEFRLKITSLKSSSMEISTRVWASDQPRLSAQQILVFVNAQGHPTPWPEQIRARAEQMKRGADET